MTRACSLGRRVNPAGGDLSGTEGDLFNLCFSGLAPFTVADASFNNRGALPNPCLSRVGAKILTSASRNANTYVGDHSMVLPFWRCMVGVKAVARGDGHQDEGM